MFHKKKSYPDLVRNPNMIKSGIRGVTLSRVKGQSREGVIRGEEQPQKPMVS